MEWYAVFAGCALIIIITCIFIIFDILTGIAGGIKEKALNSTALREGLWHKSGFIGLILLAYILEVASLYIDLGFEIPSIVVTCVYIIITECVSIFENLCILNPEITNSPLGQIFEHAHRIEAAEELEEENANA